jgi:hypothetical protein
MSLIEEIFSIIRSLGLFHFLVAVALLLIPFVCLLGLTPALTDSFRMSSWADPGFPLAQIRP